LIVTDDGEKRYGATISIVVVGPVVVHADVRVALLLVAGFGAVVVRGAEPAVVAELADVVAVARCFLPGAALEAVGELAADADVAEVGMGGDWEPCTRTFGEPLLQAVTASINPSPAASTPSRPLPTVPMPT